MPYPTVLEGVDAMTAIAVVPKAWLLYINAHELIVLNKEIERHE